MPFLPLCSDSEAILSKIKWFVPVTSAGAFIWNSFHPSCRDLGRKERDLSNRASPASHTNQIEILRRKEWRGKPALLTGLI